MKLKNDAYRKKRGGSSRILELSCRKCTRHVAYYQKDGPGDLRRLYIDRLIDPDPVSANFICRNCHEHLGVYTIYKKEARPCYRLFVDTIKKKVVPVNSI